MDLNTHYDLVYVRDWLITTLYSIELRLTQEIYTLFAFSFFTYNCQYRGLQTVYKVHIMRQHNKYVEGISTIGKI